MYRERVMKKIADLEKREQEDARRKVEAFASLLDVDSWTSGAPLHNRTKDYGLCSDCTEFRHYKTEYGRGYGYCGVWEKYISTIDKIIECANYSKRGQMSLSDMQDIAIIIEIDNRKIGF